MIYILISRIGDTSRSAMPSLCYFMSYLCSKEIPMEDWPLRSCLDLGFPGITSVAWSYEVLGEEPPVGSPKVAQTPRCTADASSIDDCPDDPAYNPSPLKRSVYAVCTPGVGGAGSSIRM